jgi:hypothetical protein
MIALNLPSPAGNVRSAETYTDGRPSARHTYGGWTYDPVRDKVFTQGGAESLDGSGVRNAWELTLSNLPSLAYPGATTWTLLNSCPGNSCPGNSSDGAPYGMMTAFDPNSGLMFTHSQNSLWSFDFSTNTWTQRAGGDYTGLYPNGLVINDPSLAANKHVFVVIGYISENPSQVLESFDITPGSGYPRTNRYTSSCSFLSAGNLGAAYDPVGHQIVVYPGTGSTYYTIDPSQASWTCVPHTPAGSGPSSNPASGTMWGRFSYSPYCDCFVAVTSPSADAFILRLRSGTVPPPAVAVSLSPTSATLLTGGTQQFTATVTGSSNTSVTWSATGGTVSASGLYTAPATAGTYTVKATSAADTTKSASATCTVSAPAAVAISVSPTSASVSTGGTQQFTATVTGSSNTSVTWSATGGTVSASGLYTAPATAGTYTVKATSVADTTKSASAAVTVTQSDTTPPTVGITSPADGSTVSGTVTVSATASDNVAVASVQLQVDSGNVGTADTTTPYSFSWNSASVANGTHLLTAKAIDTSGNTAVSSSVVVNVSNSTPPPSGINGWSNRTAGINVPGGAASIVSSQSFDNIVIPTSSGDSWKSGAQGYFQLYDPASVTRDCTAAADSYSGACSLKYTILAGYFQGEPGWYDYNFSPNLATTFGDGQEFYVQYRERIQNMTGSSAYNGSAEGFKHHLISEGDAPGYEANNCDNHPAQYTVKQMEGNGNYPGAFINCGYSGGGSAFMQYGYQDFQLPISGNFMDQVTTGCPHYRDGSHTSYPSGDPSCWNYVDSEWMTIQVHMKIGTFNNPTSVADVWFGHEGQPARLIENAADAAVPQNGAGTVNKYGKIILLPYNTAGTAQVSGAFWYDDLIVSTRRIPDPDVATPNAPDLLSLSNITSNSITVNWRVNSQNATAQDDTGFLVERCTGAVATCFPPPQSGFTQIGTTAAGASSYVDNTVVAGTTYTYRVRAKNAAGNSAYAASICFNGSGNCGGTAKP